MVRKASEADIFSFSSILGPIDRALEDKICLIIQQNFGRFCIKLLSGCVSQTGDYFGVDPPTFDEHFY